MSLSHQQTKSLTLASNWQITCSHFLISSFTQPVNQCVLSTHHVLGTLLDATVIKKELLPQRAYNLLNSLTENRK